MLLATCQVCRGHTVTHEDEPELRIRSTRVIFKGDGPAERQPHKRQLPARCTNSGWASRLSISPLGC